MNLFGIRKEILNIDEAVSELKTEMLAELALHGESATLFKFINVCAEIQDKINAIKTDIQEIELEEEAKLQEEWEEEQEKIELEYYSEGVTNA